MYFENKLNGFVCLCAINVTEIIIVHKTKTLNIQCEKLKIVADRN